MASTEIKPLNIIDIYPRSNEAALAYYQGYLAALRMVEGKVKASARPAVECMIALAEEVIKERTEYLEKIGEHNSKYR